VSAPFPFVQIAASADGLVALDSVGQVWHYQMSLPSVGIKEAGTYCRTSAGASLSVTG